MKYQVVTKVKWGREAWFYIWVSHSSNIQTLNWETLFQGFTWLQAHNSSIKPDFFFLTSNCQKFTGIGYALSRITLHLVPEDAENHRPYSQS